MVFLKLFNSICRKLFLHKNNVFFPSISPYDHFLLYPLIIMDYCDVNLTKHIFFDHNNDGAELIELLYRYLCPPLLVACVVSVTMNVALFITGHLKIRQKSPILLLSLNLACTDTIASLLVALGFLFNSYLPVVYKISFSTCHMLTLEIARTSALIASVLHLLALAFIHYKGIVRPLHYR